MNSVPNIPRTVVRNALWLWAHLGSTVILCSFLYAIFLSIGYRENISLVITSFIAIASLAVPTLIFPSPSQIKERFFLALRQVYPLTISVCLIITVANFGQTFLTAATNLGLIIVGYLFGSIPFGVIIVKLRTGKGIHTVENGYIRSTNAVRAAGFGAGLLTTIMDILKGAAAVWVAQALDPTNHVSHVLAPIFAILGHTYSLFLLERDPNGKLKFHGGPGGAPAIGGAMGLWLPMFPIIFAIGALIWFTIGIASLTTMAIGLVVIIIFTIRASLNLQDPIDIWYGVIAEFLLIWALRPNIKKLLSGNEHAIKNSLYGRLILSKHEKEK